MRRNMSNLDRIIRFILAVVFAYLLLTGIVTGPLFAVLGVASAALLVTSLFAFCPIYLFFKFSTNRG